MSGIHTQATNFMDFIKTGVDARTGQFTIAFQLPLMPANQLAGPSISPTLSFSVMGSSRNRGFGMGWSLDLSELDLHQDTPTLRLSSGEQFAVDLDSSDLTPGGELAFFDVKLKSMVVTCQSEGAFRIDHKTGQSEILERQQDSSRYLVTEIRSPEGRRVHVQWSAFANDDFILEKIRDESRTLLHIESNEGQVQFKVPGQKTETLRLQLSNDMLGDIYLPGIESPFSIVYDQHSLDDRNHLLLPTKMTSPLGASDSVTWGTGEFGHRLPPGAPFPVLPRVVEWKHSAGTSSTELTRSYEWDGVHNFMGYASDQAFDWQNGRDNLYEVEQDYNYELTETQTDHKGKTLATITRNWNRFHLLTRETIRRGDCEIQNSTTYGIVAGTPWADQPAWCQLPHKQITTFLDHRANKQRSEETEYRYDASGNVVFTRTPDGIEEHNEYYPASGGEGCPASPLGMVRFLKKKTLKPASLADGTFGGASETSTAYTYQALSSCLKNGPEFVVVSSETVRDETHSRLMETTTQTYVTEPGPHYARMASKVTTLNGKATTTLHRHEITANQLDTHVTIRGFENNERVSATQSSARSLTTGQLTRERNQAGVLSRYEYDALGRITLAVSADDSRYRAERTTTYHVNDKVALLHRAKDENPVMIEHRLATGQRRREWLDGEGRTVRVELEDIDHAPGVFREVMRTLFDAEGRTLSETQVDWLRSPDDRASVSALELTTTTQYDDWGQVAYSTSPDRVQSCSQHDPVTQTLKRWQQNRELRGPATLTRHNPAGSPISEALLDTNGTTIRSKEWVRDGLDRIVSTLVKVPGQPARVNIVQLDFYGRIIEQRLADDTVVNWTYAQHSDANHPETIAVTPPTVDTEQANS